MRALTLSLLLLCAACAYDPLGIGPDAADAADTPDASDAADAGTSDAGDELPVEAKAVEPGCQAEDGWCDRTPRFEKRGKETPQPPGYLSAMASNATGVWAAGQDFEILRWTGDTWVREHRDTGEVRALWVDASGFGVAVGSVPGAVRTRKVLLRHPDGRWSPLTLPVSHAEGDLTGVWGVAGDGAVRFRATTGSDVLFEGDDTGAVDVIDLPQDAVALVALEAGALAVLVGGAKGVWRVDDAGDVAAESSTVSARSFFRSSGGLAAEGDGKVWLRSAAGVWTPGVAPQHPPLASCGGDGDALLLTGGSDLVRDEGLTWRKETVTAPAQTSLSACLSFADGSGWAVGYVIATGLPGIVLRQEAP